MADGIMFGALDSFESLDYFNSHRTGEIITKDRVYDLNFFAVLDTDAYESMVYDVGDRDLGALRAWLQNNNAMIYDAQAAQGDKIVALSTCRDATTSGRLVIFATMTERVLLPMEVENYEAEYDAQSHSAADQIKVKLPEGTTVEYSVDGGLTWSKTPPTVENVMRDTQTQEVTAITVMVKAFHPDYGRAAEASFTMKVLPKQVTVTADPAGKIYGDDDPQPFTAKTEGTIGEDSVVIDSITRAEGEDVGTYPITPAGKTEQGNYTVSYVPGVFTISPKTGLELVVNGFDDVYDGQSHAASAGCNDPEATVEYSVDGGETWSATPPLHQGRHPQCRPERRTDQRHRPRHQAQLCDCHREHRPARHTQDRQGYGQRQRQGLRRRGADADRICQRHPRQRRRGLYHQPRGRGERGHLCHHPQRRR